MMAAGLPNRLFPDPEEDEEEPKSPPEEPLELPNREEPVLELEPKREEDCGLFSATEVVAVPNMEEEDEAGWG